jgi:hypothetical protein
MSGSALVQDPPALSSPAPAPPPREPERDPARNIVFAELLGSGLLYSVNYERLFPSWNIGVRAGASFITYAVSQVSGSSNLVLATFPIVASYYWGPSPHKLELGLGATVLYFSASTDSSGTKFDGAVDGLGVAATAVVGYRYLPRNGGWTFGIGFTPLLRATKGFLPWGGVNGGYAF